MKDRSILVDIDETSAGLMERINSQFVSDIHEAVSSSVAKLNNEVSQQLDYLSQKNSAGFNEIKEINKKYSRDVEEIVDLLYNLEDIIKGIEGLDKIVDFTSKLTSSIDSVRTNLLNELNSQQEEIKQLVDRVNGNHIEIADSIDRIHQGQSHNAVSITNSITGIKQELLIAYGNITKGLSKINDDLIEKYEILTSAMQDVADKISEEIKGKIVSVSDQLSSLKDSSKNIICGIGKINALMSSNVNEIKGCIDVKSGELNHRIDNIDASIGNLAKCHERSIADLRIELNQRYDDLSTRMDKILSAIEMSKEMSEIHHDESKTFLQRIVYLTTPFWNRKKLSSNED